MLTEDIEKTQQAWINLKEILFIPKNEIEYQKLVNMLDILIDEVGENEAHPLADLMEIIGFFIETYETDNVPEL